MKRLYALAAALCCSATSTLLSDVQTLPVSKQAQAIYDNLVTNHWVPSSGLFISFVGTSDRKLTQQSSTYEQGAVGLLAVRVGDTERAEKLFQFFKKEWADGPMRTGPRYGVRGLANFYNAEFGGEGIEKIIHVGPNAWAGLFAARYGNVYKRREAAQWALEMARWIAEDVPHEKGGVAMGVLDDPRNIPWPKIFSVENNISYYALLSEVLRSPYLNAADRAYFQKERSGVEKWICTVGYDPLANTMNRGTNPNGVDRIRALDTFTWLISALGPERLRANGIDPDYLMRKIQQSFVVKVGERWGVDPADQSEAEWAAGLDERGPHGEPARSKIDQNRMIWYEGLGEYLVTLQRMIQDSQQRGRKDLADFYAEKLRFFKSEFDAAQLKGFTKGTAFMYATRGKFFHDGWWSPKEGEQGPVSSLIAGTWRVFAELEYDPMADQPVIAAGTNLVTVRRNFLPQRKSPRILFGTSEDMTVRAWTLLDEGKINLAIEQAEATIQEWSSYAKALQTRKQSEWGHVLEFKGDPKESQEIFSYWALNDVAACYFIMGKAWHMKRQYGRATQAFQQIVTAYPLAQVWDPRGWFWSPVDAVVMDYVRKDPETYGSLMPKIFAEGSTRGKAAY